MQQPSWTACQLRESILLRSQATDYGTLECAILTRDANLQFWRLRRAVPLHSAKFQLSVISASVAVLCPVLFGLGRRLCCQNCCQRHASNPASEATTSRTRRHYIAFTTAEQLRVFQALLGSHCQSATLRPAVCETVRRAVPSRGWITSVLSLLTVHELYLRLEPFGSVRPHHTSVR